MAGHSKWANTKHRKAAQDAKRGKIFTKIIRELVTAARLGGGDPASNPRLRAAVDKALSNNMTRDTLNRAIARGVGGDEDANMETIIYEGYGPGGTAVMVECLSDNRNRTVAEVRHAFTKTGVTSAPMVPFPTCSARKALSPSRKAMKTLSWKRRWKQAQKTW